MVKRRARLAVAAAFTLVELMVSTGVVVLLAAVLFALVSHFTDDMRTVRSTAEKFEASQRAFETLTRRVGQATLNGYWESAVVTGTIRRYQRIFSEDDIYAAEDEAAHLLLPTILHWTDLKSK